MSGNRIALYLHWPFCLAKCPYCDFNSHAVEDPVDWSAWKTALLRELDTAAGSLPDRDLVSIFFGGGTPSLMDPAAVAAVIDRATAHWTPVSDLEITLEANPGAAEADRFRDFRAAGVTRLSLGVQSFDDDALRYLGRVHDAAEARRALDLARETFERFSLDLIYALPGQAPAAWEDQLRTALAWVPEHLSVYQLTIEPGTAFARRGETALDPDAGAGLYEVTQGVLQAAGLPAYEVSNHARPGAECRHNLVYWTGGDYLGIGPGAHSRLTRPDGVHAMRRIPGPSGWLKRVTDRGDGLLEDATLAPRQRFEELVLMGLRLTKGVDLAAVQRRTGLDPVKVLNTERLRMLQEDGWVSLREGRLAATAEGRLRLNAVLAALLV